MKGFGYSASERIESLDLLRGLAAIAVMVPHFFMYYLNEGSAVAEVTSVTAVEVFFVLSGFVLGPQIVLCARRNNWATLRTFLVRRWMRTVPSYLVALLAISVISGEVGSADLFRYTAYIQNLFSQHNTRDYYPVAWSLSVEEWYYLVFPPFLMLYGALLINRGSEWLGYVCGALLFIVCVTLIRSLYGDTADWGAHVRRVVIFRIDSIAYGFLLFLVLRHMKFEWTTRLRVFASLLLAATTFALLYINAKMLDSDSGWLKQIHPFASAAFGMATLGFFLSLNLLFRARWRGAVCRYLGQISYPIYLFHLAILYLLARYFPSHNDPWHFFLYASAVVLFTTIFFYGFERPILANRPRYPHVTATGPAPIHDSEKIIALKE
jgi:peptidoglycan/LPS O-acetylase OafA/YrhL